MANCRLTQRRLTQRLIDNLTPGETVREVRDTELSGFGVRIRPSGRKRFFTRAQTNGQRTWKAIGDAGTMPLSDARILARSHLAALRNDRPSPSAEALAETPFEDVAEAAFRRKARTWKPGTRAVNRNYLKNQILPRFGGQPIGAITCADVQQWFASLRSTPAAADRAAPVLSAIMREAEALGFRPEGSNPCVNIRRYRRSGRGRCISLIYGRDFPRLTSRPASFYTVLKKGDCQCADLRKDSRNRSIRMDTGNRLT